ncbi:MAG: MCE family protein [Candidatus Krumholzibacteriota bacterium]|nr:MCE family protein [Candidatus Krumholzibacteriota bacterium]
MDYKTLEIRVGLTIFIAVLVFTIGLMWFEGFDVGRKTYVLHAVFPMVGGIDPGDAVNVNGVEQGEVKQVDLREKDVIITMAIDVRARIPEDSRVVLQTRGIMGERIVSIILGDSQDILQPGSILTGVYDPGISEALASMGKVIDDLSKLAADMDRITRMLTEGGKLSTVIENLASITTDLRDGIKKNSETIDKGFNSFSRSAERIDSILERNSAEIDSLFSRLEYASQDLPGLLEKMNLVTIALIDVMERLRADDNTFGTLLNDRELLDKLEKAVDGISELVADVKKNPKKYLTVEIF